MSQPTTAMAHAASLFLPDLDPAEREVLRDLQSKLQRHPYMRADLEPSSPIERGLEEALSLRMAWLHTRGLALPKSPAASLLEKLLRAEARLVAKIRKRPGSADALLRYETALLLHPTPGHAQCPVDTSARLEDVIRRWEHARDERSLRVVLSDKAKQSGQFFRHGAVLPFYWVRRKRIRRSVPSAVLAHPALRETYRAIEQMGPIVDNFAFGGAGAIRRSSSVTLADVAFLYMQLADEFLDELATASGGHRVVERIIRPLYRFSANERPLRDLSLGHLTAIGVDPEAHETKFGLTLGSLFSILCELGKRIDALLEGAEPRVVGAAHTFLHHCFQTYLDEVALVARAPDHRADRMPLAQTAWHFYRKNNLVMMLWLDLRARLLGLDPADHASCIRRWGYLLASFQIFDDLKDVALDLGRQPSYAIQIAANDFPDELQWLERRFAARRAPISRDEIPELNVHAHETVQRCMDWSRLIALAHFDNVLSYAWDQRWRKSWTERRNSFNPGDDRAQTRTHAVDRLLDVLSILRSRGEPEGSDDRQLAFALDAAAYDGSWQIYLALFPNLRAIYRFATLRMRMSAAEKARAARRLLQRFPRRRASLLVRLGDGDVDHQVASDGLEAFSKVIEA